LTDLNRARCAERAILRAFLDVLGRRSGVDAHMVTDQRRRFEQSFYYNERLLINWLTKILGDADAARDVAQCTFLNIWKLAQKRSVESPKALIFKTAANLAANELRRRRRLNSRISSKDAFKIDEIHDINTKGPEELMATRQEARAIMLAINRLPEKPRQAFTLHRFDGLNYQQIAASMHVSESSVEKYIMEALRILRGVLT
jgi:RNA polymerase sigma-70 factor (ECF subfamily)